MHLAVPAQSGSTGTMTIQTKANTDALQQSELDPQEQLGAERGDAR